MAFSRYKNSWLILSGSGTIYYKSFYVLLFLQALECFCQAASEVGKEEFLDRLIRSEDGEIVSTPRLQYYDKVLAWFGPSYTTLGKHVTGAGRQINEFGVSIYT